MTARASSEQVAREWWNAHWTQQDGAAIASLARLLESRERPLLEQERDKVSAAMVKACEAAGLVFGSPLHQDPAEGFEAAVVEAFRQVRALENEACAAECDRRVRLHRQQASPVLSGPPDPRWRDAMECEACAAAIRARSQTEGA